MRATRLDDRARHRAGVPLFAESRDDRGEIAFARTRNDCGSARAIVPHAHIERTVEAKRKPALGLIELHRRHAEIEHRAVDRSVGHDGMQVAKALFDQFEAAARFFDQTGAARDRALVAVETDHAGPGRCEDSAGIAAGPERRIDIAAAGMRGEVFDNPVEQNRYVTAGSAATPALTVGCAHADAPRGAAPIARQVPP